jgi:predicted lipid-binding transport protein (Tim44 family)
MTFLRPRRWLASLGIGLAALLLMADVADARAGRGGSFGLRGSRSFAPPPVTRTAPREAAPLQRQQDAGPAQTPRAAASPGTRGPLAGRGGFVGGLLGAGFIGMLLGYGLFGGIAGLASFLGLLLQMAVIVGIVVLALRWFRGQGQPVPAGIGVPLHRRAQDAPPIRPTGGLGGGRQARGSDEVGIGQADYDAFERILGELETGYGRGDRAALRRLALPEVADRLERELDADAARNVVNRIGEVRLLQGDLAEAWRENGSEYATVAMRFALVDHVEDLATGRVVDGDPRHPTEATEIWTFRRDGGGPWRVSAIQLA